MHSANGGIEEKSKDFSPFFLLLKVLTNLHQYLGLGFNSFEKPGDSKIHSGSWWGRCWCWWGNWRGEWGFHSPFHFRRSPHGLTTAALGSGSGLSFSLQLDLTPRVCRALSLSLPLCRVCRFLEFTALLSLSFCRVCRFVEFVVWYSLLFCRVCRCVEFVAL